MAVVHEDDIDRRTTSAGTRFASTSRRLGAAAGGRGLQCTLYEVEPGKTAFPFHAHMGIEEGLYVLEGTGTLRLGHERHEVRPGSYAAFPVGEEHAHQLINTGDGPLRYLCLSDTADPEVVVYPDSGKVMCAAGGWPPKIRQIARRGESLGYYDGEDTGE